VTTPPSPQQEDAGNGELESLTVPITELVDSIIDPSILIDASGVIRKINALLTEQSGFTSSDLVGTRVLDRSPLWSLQKYRSDAVQNLYLELEDAWGVVHVVSTSVIHLIINQERWHIITLRDDSQRMQLQSDLENATTRFRHAFEDAVSPMFFATPEGIITEVNNAFLVMVGRTRSEVVGYDENKYILPGVPPPPRAISPARCIKKYLHKEGRVVTAEATSVEARDPKGTGYYVVSERDVTQEILLTENLAYQALHDPLTRLANRTLFDENLHRALTNRNPAPAAVLLIDLDDFKVVNDTYGHVVGDELLTLVAKRLSSAARADDTLARYGGDEFIYLAENVTPEQATQLAARLLAVLVQPFYLANVELNQMASIGVSHFNPGESADVVHLADRALYAAKAAAKGSFLVAPPASSQ
jgi:diguanylate cyclase (GGDEF)-like protein